MNIRKLCYELYKIDWKQSHMITMEEEMNNLRRYYEMLISCENPYTYDDYLNEYGYEGTIYVCYEEFCQAEYLDMQYMCNLLSDNDLVKLYHSDIKTSK